MTAMPAPVEATRMPAMVTAGIKRAPATRVVVMMTIIVVVLVMLLMKVLIDRRSFIADARHPSRPGSGLSRAATTASAVEAHDPEENDQDPNAENRGDDEGAHGVDRS
jgi:hypothetical protein